jgi:hypothetical protein
MTIDAQWSQGSPETLSRYQRTHREGAGEHNALRIGIQSWIQEHPQVTKRRSSKKSASPPVSAPPVEGLEVEMEP